MIPTFLGILVINFVVLRMQGQSLVDVAKSDSRSEGGGAGVERSIRSASKQYENHIDRFRRVGNDRPPLLNFQGFLDKDDILDWLRDTDPRSPLSDSRRNRREKDLWLVGPFAVGPLAEILADDALSVWHGPASQALALCAYATLDPRDFDRLPQDRIARLIGRNEILRNNIIDFRRDAEVGFAITDPDAEAKRQRLIDAVSAADNPEFHPGMAARWSAILFDTGFAVFTGNLFTGNLYSHSQKRYVFDIIGERWSVTVWINLIAVVLAWTGSIPLGIRSARRRGTLEDRVTTNGLFFLWSLPSFFVGALLLHHFCTDGATFTKAPFPNQGLSSQGSLWFGILRYLGDLLWHGFLPMLVLSYASFTALSRYMRANLLEQLNSDYARTAFAKGCTEDRVVYQHCLRNSLITMITLGSGLLGELFSGALIVEMLFSIPGLGLLMLEGAKAYDAPLIMGSTIISVGLLLIGILIADICYAVVDPRVRSRYA